MSSQSKTHEHQCIITQKIKPKGLLFFHLKSEVLGVTVLVRVQKPSTEVDRTEILEDFCGMFRYTGKGKNRLSWERGEGLIEKVRFPECPNLFPLPPPFWRPCYLTFEGLRSQSYRLGKSRRSPTKCLFVFILLVCFWKPRCLGCTCQYFHLPLPRHCWWIMEPFPFDPRRSSESFPPFFYCDTIHIT